MTCWLKIRLQLASIALPEPLKSVHVKTYDAIASYLEALEYLNGESATPTLQKY